VDFTYGQQVNYTPCITLVVNSLCSVACFSPSLQQRIMPPLIHSSPQWHDVKNQKKKAELVGWDKDGLTEQQRKRKITTIILIKTIYKERDTQCNFSHCPMPSPLLSSDSPPPASSSTYIPSMTSYGIIYTVWLAGLSLPSCVPSPFPMKINSILDKTRTSVFTK